MKIYLADNLETGHHKVYEDTLLKINNTKALNIRKKFVDIKKNCFKAYLQRKYFLKKILEVCNDDVVHLLYIDSLYKCPFIELSIKNKINTYIGTLHWIPHGKIEYILLKRFSRKLKCVVVHSEFLKEELKKNGIHNVVCIDYPSFLGEFNTDKKIKNDNIIISCLGGTRYDKGLDILVESFKYLSNESKNKILFNICGIEQDIKFDIIENEAKKYDINIILKNKFMSDDEYKDEIINSDVILLPYRKIFSGNSGPMTDGIYANKFIVCPSFGNLGYLNKRYKLGLTFNIEDEKDLARVIIELCKTNLQINSDYREKLKISNFINNYSMLYERE